jgi:hypothetical protein
MAAYSGYGPLQWLAGVAACRSGIVRNGGKGAGKSGGIASFRILRIINKDGRAH